MAGKDPGRLDRRIDYLLGTAITLLIVLVLYPPLRLLWSRVQLPGSAYVSAVRLDDLLPGNASAFSYRGRRYLAINLDGEIHALSAECTYREAVLTWDRQRRQLVCPAHGEIYDIHGGVVSGPASRPLSRLLTRTAGGWIYARHMGDLS